MTTGKDDLLSSLIEAYLMEKATNEFYAFAAQKARDSSAAAAFRALCDWEEKHMEFIRFLYQSVMDDRDVAGFEEFSKKTPAPVSESGIPVKDLEAKLEKPAYSDDKGAFAFALEMEAKAYNLYGKLADAASDGNASAVYREMMRQEQQHIDYLKKAGASLA